MHDDVSMLFKAGRTFVFTLMCLCLLGRVHGGSGWASLGADRIINEPAMYTVETVFRIATLIGLITHHNCTALEIQEGNFVCCMDRDMMRITREEPDWLTSHPDTGCTWNQTCRCNRSLIWEEGAQTAPLFFASQFYFLTNSTTSPFSILSTWPHMILC